ncbi:MAG: hypothetical protein PHS14_21095 [Elusimicrobia bacterium]|nr:hypothetical protein [Elusimicrobiota bacterium]
MALDPGKNFAKAALASGITSGATSLTLVSGGGAKFPAAGFNAVLFNSTDYLDPSDDPAVEVVRVGTISGDTLPITRGQESTTGVAHNTAGKTYTLVAGPTSKLLSDIDSTYAAKATTLAGYGITDALGLHATADAAAKWATARSLAGNSIDGSADVAFSNKFVVQGTADAGLSGPQFLGALGTGIVKNTTTTGVLSIAVAGDFPTLNQSTTGYSGGVTVNDDHTTNGNFAPLFAAASTGGLTVWNCASKLLFNPSTGALAATTFLGALTGNVTGNVSGSSGSCTGASASCSGNAASATFATSAANITTPDGLTTVLQCLSDSNFVMAGSGTHLYLNGPYLGICTAAASFGAPLTISLNAAALQAPLTGTLAQFGGVDAGNPIVMLDAYGGSPILMFRRADGTAASPTAIQNGENLGVFQGRAWTSAGAYSGNAGGFNIVCVEPSGFSSTAHGTVLQMYTVPISSVTVTLAATFGSDQTLTVVGKVTAPGFIVSGAVAGQALDASGAGAIWPGIGTLRTIKETVFAGITPASYSNGTTTTIDGCGYTCVVAGNGAVDMVATGLRLRRGTTSGSTASSMTITHGNTGDFVTLLGETRFRRGRWALWIRMASFDYTNTASGNTWAGLAATIAYPRWGFQLRSRTRSLNGTPNTSTGGVSFNHWMFGTDPAVSSYPGIATPDVLCAFVQDLSYVDVYYGTYSSGWPTIESMTLMGRMTGYNSGTWVTGGVSTPISAALVDLLFEFGGAASTSTGTAEIIWDRWRLTAWE